jgi:hypothetical protein
VLTLPDWMARVWRRAAPSHRDDPSIREPQGAPSSVPFEFLPLHRYLTDRYASNVVLSFAQIEALTGVALPQAARVDAGWWTSGATRTSRHPEAWASARRSASPNLAARNVSFERIL